MHLPDIIVDTVLLFAARKVYALDAGLELRNVLPRAGAAVTHRYVFRRLVSATTLGKLGNLDLLQKYSYPHSSHSIKEIATATAAAGHLHILDWALCGWPAVLRSKPTTFFSLLDLVFIDATEHARLPVMEWCTSSGLDLTDSLRVYFDVATTYCRLESLEYLKAYALERNLPYKFGTGLSLEQEFPSGRYLAMLNWWKIEHAVQQRPPLVETDMGSLVEAA